MAYAPQADRAFPQSVIYLAAAALAAVLLTGILALSAVDLFGFRAPVGDGVVQINPAVVELGRRWELQYEQQLGYVDPVIDAGRDWERQRKQQAGWPY